MRVLVSAIFACCIIALLLVAGCEVVKATQKAGAFGTSFGASSEEQKAIDWFKDKYGDPIGNPGPARFVEPLITSGLTEKDLPVDKVTTFPQTGGSVYFFVIYDNFKKGDPITVTWTYLENGKEITNIQQQAGGDFGRFIAEIQRPDPPGWGRGKQRITITGDGVTASVNFTIGDTLQTTPLPYTAGGQGHAGIPGSTVAKPGLVTTTPGRLSPGLDGGVTPVAAPADLSSDTKNCGSTGNKCPDAFSAITTCSGGKCGFTCKANYADCNGNPTDGCEVYLGAADNCGACGNVCEFPHGWGDCSNSECVLQRCDDGWYSINENDADGCESSISDFNVDRNNCGSFGHKCDAGKYCEKGSCVECKSPRVIANDGRCVDLLHDLKNCGSLGHSCWGITPHTHPACWGGKCGVYGCSNGWTYCDGSSKDDDGCEVNINSDVNNCGGCRKVCPSGQTCNKGVCTSP